MNKDALATRLGEYISCLLPDAHGHQQKAVCDFIRALVSVRSCCQATLARFFDNFEAASKRLSRLLHNARLEPDRLARSHAQALCARLPPVGMVRLSLDWTSEEAQHLLIASLRVGRRAIPLYWRAYQDSELAERMTLYEREFLRVLFNEVLGAVSRRRFLLTADRLLSKRPLSAVGMAAEYARRFTCEEGFRDGKRLLGFVQARINCIEAWSRMFLLVAVPLTVLTKIGCALVQSHDGEQLLRRVRSRRSARSELSLVRSIVELLAQGEDLWQLLDHQWRFNLEAGL